MTIIKQERMPTDTLTKDFEDCKNGEKGVMPYNKGDRYIKFVWTNGLGYGRIAKIELSDKGIKEAWKLYQEIVKINDETKSIAKTDSEANHGK